MGRRLVGLLGLGGIGGVGALVLFLAACVAVFFLPDMLVQRGIRQAVSDLTHGEAHFDRVRLTEDGATILGLNFSHGGRRIAYVDRVELFCDPTVLATMRWTIERAELHGVELNIAEEDASITLPPRTWALVWSVEAGIVPRTEIDRLEVHGLVLRGSGRRGKVDGELFWAGWDRVVLAPGEVAPLRFEAAEARSVDLRWNGHALGGFTRAVLGADGLLDVQGLRLHTSVQDNGLPVWPPLLVQWVPDWAGGRATTQASAAERAWFGADPSWWPWHPMRARWSGLAVIADQKIALRPMVWTATPMRGTLGPLRKSSIPWTLSTGWIGGTLTGTGQVWRSGTITGHLHAEELEAKQLDPYLAVNLSKLGVSIREGTLAVDVDLELRRSWLSIQGTTHLYKVRFDRTNLISGVSKGVLTSASWLLGGNDKTFATDVHVRGDFRTEEFSPLRQLFGQVSSGVVKDAGRRVARGAKDAVKGVGSVFNRIFKRKEREQADEPGVE